MVYSLFRVANPVEIVPDNCWEFKLLFLFEESVHLKKIMKSEIEFF